MQRILHRVTAGLFLVCGILPLFVGYTLPPGFQTEYQGYVGDVRQLIALIFWSSVIVGRVFAIVRNHKWRSLVPNVILILLAAFWGLSSYAVCDVSIALLALVVQSLAGIFSVVFAHVRLDVLRKIIRKTYASEIILGLLLLMCAFSYVLSFVEESIPTFADGLWYCFAIVTTIGFGDIAATSLVGRVLSVILGGYGIVVVSLITSIIVNFYGETRRDPDEDNEVIEADGPGEPNEAGKPDEVSETKC